MLRYLHVVLQGHIWAGVHKGAAVAMHQGGYVQSLGSASVSVATSIQ